ncbi:hypothetical protein B9Z65_7880 [Elsinoe australis]|uniref:THUMP domain-containing protein n=1 Tax=Elsinoe australis TaxID=40998 RepID=A0A2P8A0S1_9PEZI|nr:hypothetical protein B9Z65_7880 [Elsinoe australis]
MKTHIEQAKKSWRVPNKSGPPPRQSPFIRFGDAGIWVTCHKNQEKKCIGEVRDLFEEYSEAISPETGSNKPLKGEGSENGDEDDIEREIRQEVSDIHKPTQRTPFEAIFLEVPCLVFFRINNNSIDPVAFVRKIMEDAAADPSKKRTRCTQRLVPSTLVGHASEEGLERTAKEVLAPHFHAENQQSKKFAIRPTIRNHTQLKRDTIIKKVASMVGDQHSVDLKNYDALILVDILKNVVGISVVGREYDRLKRFNLQEIFEPTPQQPKEQKQEGLQQESTAGATAEQSARD